jgi:hypothetical protein
MCLLLIALCGHNAIADELVELFQARKSWFDERNLVVSAIKENDRPKYINSLIRARSPYLLSHALQPVNWQEWRPSFEQDFDSHNKLIFISIGYETCHWCHVMAQESFNSEAVAGILNRHFVAIKVDREQWPLVDNRYKSALELLKGEAGWPINVILTPSGELLWADAYLTQAKLIKVISVLSQRWQTQPKALQAIASSISAQLIPPLNNAISTDLDTKSIIAELNAEGLNVLQEEANSGGPRFLREYWLLGLLGEYLSRYDKRLLEVVKRHVDAILLSPTYDAIEGGFHRYAVDGSWQQPHFEKMLYTQAFMIKVLARLTLATGDKHYQFAMEQTIAWVESTLGQPDGRASAISAVSDGKEGQYYRFNYDVNSRLQQTEFALVHSSEASLVALTRLSADWRDSQTHQLLTQLRHSHRRPLVDGKVIISWNAMYISALLDAYRASKDMQFLQLAQGLANTLWDAARVDNKLYRTVFEREASIDATLEDFAWMAYAFTQLSFFENWPASGQEHQIDDRLSLPTQKERALWLLDELAKQYRFSSVGFLNRDGEVPSVYSSVYRAMALGYQSFGEKRYRDIARELLARHSDTPKDRYGNYSFWQAVGVDKSNIAIGGRYFAKGHGKASLSVLGDNLVVGLDLAPGWHINANPSSNEKLIATKVEVFGDKGLFTVQYPTPVIGKLGFSQTDLALYEGLTNIVIGKNSQDIDIQEIKPETDLIKVKLQLQACSDSLCLLPETLVFPVRR